MLDLILYWTTFGVYTSMPIVIILLIIHWLIPGYIQRITKDKKLGRQVQKRMYYTYYSCDHECRMSVVFGVRMNNTLCVIMMILSCIGTSAMFLVCLIGYTPSVGTPPTLLELITRVTKGSYLAVGWISLTLVGYAILIRVGTWAYTFKCKMDKLTDLLEEETDEKN